MTRRLGIAPVFVLLGLAALSSACSTLVVPVKEPTPSALAFADAAETPAFDLVVSDARSPQERADIAGGFYVPDYRFREAALDPVAYLAEGVERELASRGLHETSGATSVKLAIRSFHFENHRVSPFAPWVALTTVSADVETARRTQRIASFVKRAKLAV